MPLFGRKLTAEVLGTYLLVLIGTSSILAAKADGSGSFSLVVAFGFGLGLLAGLYAFGEVSGGHFNPAVSLAMLVDRRIDLATMAGYWGAQIVGAVLASLTVLAVTSQEAVAATATTLGEGVDVWEAFLLEVIFTAIFLAVILKVSSSSASAATAFLAIGFTLLVIHIVLIPYTGTSVNPVRSLGPGIVGNVWSDQWLYWIAPLFGGLLGWGAFKAVTSGPDE
jgi:aquaporin Z